MRRGMTLIELMVTVAVVAIALTVALGALLGFKQLVLLNNLKRETATQVRQAARFLERDLRLAGFGLEPALAFDFTVYAGLGSYCGGSPGGEAGSNPCPAARDRIDGSDELVFYARNPEYWGGDLAGEPEGMAWAVLATDAAAVTLSAHGGEYFGRGQILQLVCSGGAGSVYARVSQTTRVGAPGAAVVPVEGAVDGDPFTQSPATLLGDCGGVARAFLVERFRYFVEPAAVLADGSTSSFLMLDKGVDRNEDGQLDARDLIPIAPGLTDLQVAYLRPEPEPTEVGTAEGVPISFCSASERPLMGPSSCPGGLRVVQFTAGAGASDYPQYSYLSAGARSGLRLGPDGGNIVGVRLGLVGRSVSQASTRNTHPLLLNRAALGPDEQDQPFVYSTTELMVTTPNLHVRGLAYL